MPKLTAVDPGEKHVGVCYDTPRGLETREFTPGDFLGWMSRRLVVYGYSGEVVVEVFKLYPGQDSRVTYRRMETSELIGAIKLMCSQHDVPVVEQDATIKKPTRRQLRARGIKQIGRGTHERDAELHYWHRRLRSGNGEAA